MLRFARNDENSRILYRDPRVKPEDDKESHVRGVTQGLGILEFLEIASVALLLTMTDEFRFYCDVIPRSSRGMTKKVKLGDDKKRKSGDDTRLMRSSGQVRG